MGLLDRVKQNQTGAPPASGPVSNGPAVATAPGGATSYSTSSAVPKARPTDTVPPASASRPPAVVGEVVPPAFTAAKVQIHAKLIERFADQIDSSNKVGVREKIVELADEYFRTTAMTMTKTDKERLVDSVLDDVLGLGPLEALLADPNITEIMANHPKQIYV
jgi:pilus assembly protein CpaF